MKKRHFILIGLICSTSYLAQAQDAIPDFDPKVAPSKFTKNISSLADYLCSHEQSNDKKVENIFLWMTHNIEHDVKALHNYDFKHREAKEVLDRKLGLSYDYAELFKALCDASSVPCQIIEGYTKDWKFDTGDKFFNPHFVWNAVQINGDWELVDAYKGSGYLVRKQNIFHKAMSAVSKKTYYSKKFDFEQKYDEEHLYADPEEVRFVQIPADPIWQLSDSIMPLEVFEASDEEIDRFNTMSRIVKNDIKLSHVNSLDEDEYVKECAERAYEYNPRYTKIIARKKFLEIADLYEKALTSGDKVVGKEIITAAKLESSSCKEILLKQKKEISTEIAALKRKNSNKASSLKKDKMSFSSGNKKLISDCKRRISQSKSALDMNKKNLSSLSKKEIPDFNLEAVRSVESKDVNDPSFVILIDSIEQRSQRLNSARSQFDQNKKAIEKLKNQQDYAYEDFKKHNAELEKELTGQTIQRFYMHDNLDEEVMVHQVKAESVKQKFEDKEFNNCLGIHDSINAILKENVTLADQLIKDSKKQLQDKKRVKKEFDPKHACLMNFDQDEGDFRSNYDLKREALKMQSDYFPNAMKMFAQSQQTFKKENAYYEVMILADDRRKDLEKKDIERDEKSLKKVNTYVLEQIKSNEKEMKELFRLVYSDKLSDSQKRKKIDRFIEQKLKTEE